jgi:hypothetical protein
VALKPRAHQNGKFGILSACVIVQAHHAQHPLALVVDGNEGHGAGRIVVDELVEQFVAHFAKRLAENATMLAMCAELGFHIAVDPDDPSVKTVTLPVHPAHLTLR